MTAAKQKPLLEARVALLEQDINNLNKGIKAKDDEISDLVTTIASYTTKDSLYTDASVAYRNQISALTYEKGVLLNQIKIDEKEIKTLKRKNKFTAFTGIAVIGILGYLYITK